MPASLLPFFEPRGVVLVGVSTSPEKLGYGAARNLAQSGYKGAIHFVSRREGQLFGYPFYTDLMQVPDPVDLAVLIIPSDAAVDAIETCGRRGIHAAVLISAGFREAGPDGAALEAAVVQAAHRNDVRIIGPNCLGVLDTYLPLDTTFLASPIPARGHIGLVSQSGAFCSAVVDWARGQHLGFSRLVSLGNQADVNETDILPILAEDSHTRVITLYLEGVGNGPCFIQAARDAGLKKPVIALKVGRFEAGRKAAASHTGAMAGSDAAFEAAFEKAGVMRAPSVEVMFDWAQALEACPLPAGHRMAVLTNAGGPGVIAADALEMNGLSIAALDPDTIQALKSLLPPAAAVRNPVDMMAAAAAEQYARCLRLLLDDNGVDGAMVILVPPPMHGEEEVARRLIPLIQNSAKPVVVALIGSHFVEPARKVFLDARIPVYPFPERAASVLTALAKRADILARLRTEPEPPRWRVQHPGKRDRAADPLELVAEIGITTAPIHLASNPAEAASLAATLGFPVVMKIASRDILHKSDVGGVMLNLQTESDVKLAFARIMKNTKKHQPEARIQGVTVQRQIEAGQDVIIGMTRDSIFGPLMMFGSGGVEVEGLKDAAFALAPLGEREACALLEKTWAGRKLAGYRGIPPADEAAVVDALIRLSRLAMEHPEFEEMEINPLRVLQKGAVALDVRAVHSRGVID